MTPYADVAFAKDIAGKIEELVDDRDFLGWEKSGSASLIILKLADKAEEGTPLHEAGSLLNRRHPGDRPRKVQVVQGALAELRKVRDVEALTGLAG